MGISTVDKGRSGATTGREKEQKSPANRGNSRADEAARLSSERDEIQARQMVAERRNNPLNIALNRKSLQPAGETNVSLTESEDLAGPNKKKAEISAKDQVNAKNPSKGQVANELALGEDLILTNGNGAGLAESSAAQDRKNPFKSLRTPESTVAEPEQCGAAVARMLTRLEGLGRTIETLAGERHRPSSFAQFTASERLRGPEVIGKLSAGAVKALEQLRGMVTTLDGETREVPDFVIKKVQDRIAHMGRLERRRGMLPRDIGLN